MQNENSVVPTKIARLITGFFMRTLLPEEHQELDKWVTDAPENLKVFEDCCDVSHRPIQPDQDECKQWTMDQTAALLLKKWKKEITGEEAVLLNQLFAYLKIDPKLFEFSPGTFDMNTAYQELTERLLTLRQNQRLN